MKAVIVLGFYDRVFVHLQKKHSALLGSTIMWIGVAGPHGDGDVRNFTSLLFDRLENGFTDILVLSAVRRGREATHGEDVRLRFMFEPVQRILLSLQPWEPLSCDSATSWWA